MRKWMVLLVAVSVVFVFSGTAFPAFIDIGDPISEAGHNLLGWGPIEPATHGGSWGGIAPGNARVIWDPPESYPGANSNARLDIDFSGANYLTFRHLDGFADDGFIEFTAGTSLQYSYYIDSSSTEQWITTSVPISGITGVQTVVFSATGAPWPDFDTYGQVAFDWVQTSANPVPEPGTMVLLGSGLIGLAGYGRKRFRK